MESSIVKGMGTLLGSIPFWVILFYFASPSFPGWAAKNWLPRLISTSLDIKMDYAGPLSTITLSLSSLVGVLVGESFLTDGFNIIYEDEYIPEQLVWF